MIHKKIKISLNGQSIKNIKNSPQYKKLNIIPPQGYLYTSYEKGNKVIRIGFIQYLNKLKMIYQDIDYEILGQRKGTLKEERLLKATLNEMGFYTKNREGEYHYSNSLMRHLKILGWPIGNLLKQQRRIKYF